MTDVDLLLLCVGLSELGGVDAGGSPPSHGGEGRSGLGAQPVDAVPWGQLRSHALLDHVAASGGQVVLLSTGPQGSGATGLRGGTFSGAQLLAQLCARVHPDLVVTVAPPLLGSPHLLEASLRAQVRQIVHDARGVVGVDVVAAVAEVGGTPAVRRLLEEEAALVWPGLVLLRVDGDTLVQRPPGAAITVGALAAALRRHVDRSVAGEILQAVGVADPAAHLDRTGGPS